LDTYEEFLKLTLKYIMLVKKWKKMIKEINRMFTMGAMEHTEEFKANLLAKKCWTDSDEAFAITILANNLEVWIEKLGNQTTRLACTRFTKVVISAGHKKRSTHKWTNEGIRYYNKMLEKIIEDRANKTEFDLAFLQSLRTTKKRKASPQPEERVTPLIDPSLMAMIQKK